MAFITKREGKMVNLYLIDPRMVSGLGAGPGGDERDDAGRDGHRDDVVEGRPERLEDVEGGEHQDGEEEGVVVEDGEGGGLVLGDLREEVFV